MTLERATQFGAAWNSHDAEKVASFFAENGEYHASFGPEPFGASYVGRDAVRRGVKAFFDRFPDGRFEDLQVFVAGDRGTFEWTLSPPAPTASSSPRMAAISWNLPATRSRRRMHSVSSL